MSPPELPTPVLRSPVQPEAETASKPASANQIQAEFRPVFIAIIMSPSRRARGNSLDCRGGWNCAGAAEMVWGIRKINPRKKSTPILTVYTVE
jgi:hypothetical protein